MKTIRLGLVGCGSMMEAHASNINKVEGIEISAVCDIAEERAAKVAEALGNDPKIVTDYHVMNDDVDAVLVALPHDLHYECGIYFARHKKHILMEKPLGNSEEECLRLIEVCEEEDVTLMCAYPVPFWSDIVKCLACECCVNSSLCICVSSQESIDIKAEILRYISEVVLCDFVSGENIVIYTDSIYRGV